MNLNQASSLRKLAGKACAFFFLLAALAVLDGLIAKFREPVNLFHLLPGDEVKIDGQIPENIKQTEDLTYDSDSPDLTVAFAAIHSGYYLGGNMWRGRLLVGKNLSPGKYTVTVRPKELPRNKPGFQFRVVVHQNPLSQRAAYRSISRRLTGLISLSGGRRFPTSYRHYHGLDLSLVPAHRSAPGRKRPGGNLSSLPGRRKLPNNFRTGQ